ncbi:hypothetical protein EMIT051CA3_30580 [Pseudomonas chlororaphis]
MSAQTYITPTMLAILAYQSFQLLYDPVAKYSINVANPQSACIRTDNFSAVFEGLNLEQKELWSSSQISMGQPCHYCY